MDVITTGHILTAALEYRGMTSLDGVPDPSKIDTNTWMEDDNYRREKLLDIATKIVDKHVDLATEFAERDGQEQKGITYTDACETHSLKGAFFCQLQNQSSTPRV